MKFVRVSYFVLFAFTLAILPSCSGGGESEIPQTDVSQLPPEEGILELAARGDLDGVKSLVESDPSLVEVRGDYGRTPLHYAAGNGQNKVVEYLLSQGADPRAADENGEFPADAARQMNHPGLEKTLAEAAESAE